MTPSPIERIRKRLQRAAQPVIDAVDAAHVVIYGEPGYCRCKVPRPDWTLSELASDEEWCWNCHLPLDPTNLLSRIAAFLA